jgi:hypothetical protein
MAKVTILAVKKALSAAFPDVVFTYEMMGRGSDRRHGVKWTGGPSKEDVDNAIPAGFGWGTWRKPGKALRTVRQMTEEESAIYWAAWEIERAAELAKHEAEAPMRKAAAITKRQKTIADKKEVKARLSAAFPDVVFDVKVTSVSWTDGPGELEIRNLLTGLSFYFHRTESDAARAAARARTDRLHGPYVQQATEERAKRLQRRLAASLLRRKVTARGCYRKSMLNAQQTFFCTFPA